MLRNITSKCSTLNFLAANSFLSQQVRVSFCNERIHFLIKYFIIFTDNIRFEASNRSLFA